MGISTANESLAEMCARCGFCAFIVALGLLSALVLRKTRVSLLRLEGADEDRRVNPIAV